MPAAQHQRRIRPEEPELQTGEIELTHRCPIRIVFPVASQNAIPSPRNPAASGKRQFRRMPVALKKGIHVALIPSLLLRIEDFGDRGAITLPLILSLAEG